MRGAAQTFVVASQQASAIAVKNSLPRLPFVLLTLMLSLFILRPWDLVPAIAVIRPMMLVTSLTIVTFLISRPRIEFWNVPPAKLLVTFLATINISVVFSYWQSQSFSIATDYLKQIALFVLIVNLVTTTERLKIFAAVIVASCTYHGVAAVADFSAGSGERLTGISEPYFGDPNDLALSLVMVLPLAWWLSSVVKRRHIQLLIYGSILVMIMGIVATQSRGGLLALISALGIVVVSQGREKLGTLLLTLAAAIVLTVIALPSDVFERYRTITQYQKDESAMTRLAVWKAGAEMCADHPLTGVGAGAFESVYGKYYIDRKGAGNVWRAAHSSYVEVAAELGVVGLVVFLAILMSAMSILFRTKQQLHQLALSADNESVGHWSQLQGFNTALIASVGGFLVGAAFLSRGYDMVFMIILSLVAVLSRFLLVAAPRSMDLATDSPLTKV